MYTCMQIIYIWCGKN